LERKIEKRLEEEKGREEELERNLGAKVKLVQVWIAS